MTKRRFELTSGTSNKFWEVASAGAAYTVTWGRIGTTGRAKTKKTPNAAKAVADLIEEKVRKGYREVGKHSKAAGRASQAPGRSKGPPSEQPASARSVSALLEQLRAIRVRLKTKAGATARELAALERELGFELPASYREFLEVHGELRVGDWRFYGVSGAAARNKAYAKEFAAGDDGARDDDGPYVPRRFVVLCDQGDYSNAGEGWVFDANLDAIIATDGARWIERGEARQFDYWAWLAERLEDLHTEAVAEQEAETQRLQHTAVLTTTASRDGAAEVERLYDVFARYEKAPRWHCFIASCKQCVASNQAFDTTPLRKLTAQQLGHYVDYALGADDLPTKSVLPQARPARQRAFKHFLPRGLELVGDLGSHAILRERKIFAKGFLTPQEREAVDAWLTRSWRVLLESSATLPVNVTVLLRCVPQLTPYLAAWEASTHPSALRLRARCAEDLRRGDSLLHDNCLNAAGDLRRRARELARWLAPDWMRRVFG